MTPTQHRYNILASSLLYLAFFLPLPLDFINKQGFFNPNKPDVNYMGVYAIMVVSLGLYYGIRRGWQWVKILFLLISAGALLATMWHFDQIKIGLYAHHVALASFVMQKVLQLAAIVLIVLSFFQKGPAQLPQPAKE